MDQPDRLAEITARLETEATDAHAAADIRWLIGELTRARADNAEMDDQLDELRYRINRAGSLMSTSYVAGAIGYTRMPWHDPRTRRTETGH